MGAVTEPVFTPDVYQLEIPGMDGYRADRLLVALSGGIEISDLTQVEDVEFVKGLRLGEEVTLQVRAIVTRKGFTLTPGTDTTGERTAYGVALKAHAVESVS